ncbi:hypothetical protein [uncultured Aquimarina sp.]|uniref:hypothetical protein n=1 Tax=uncultured Aquimarina sp. TaxID=575652 RepID=UPI002620A9C6|nr:hypothetical protein [uncultured Aquimarina sp.]
MKKITFLLVLAVATAFVSCENESINDEIVNEEINTNDTEEEDGEEIGIGNE